MGYSDAQLKDATQIAYSGEGHPLSEGFTQLKEMGETPPYDLQELIKASGSDAAVKDVFGDVDGDISNWKILDQFDNNAGNPKSTGFYGCVIDTGDGNLIVAFRGSEGMLNLHNLTTDWTEADLKLLNSTLIKQQGDVNKFLAQIANSDYIDNYNSISFTGHSLGGNLAEHAAIMSVEYGLDSKFSQCVSFDGPGFSDEYIKLHGPSIDKVYDRITHYKWSPVGGLLFSLPGVDRIPLEYKKKNIFNPSNWGYYIIGRHSTESIIFDDYGKAIRGESNLWDQVTSKFSQGIDHMPTIVGDVLVTVTSAFLYAGVWMYTKMFDDKELTPFGASVVVAAITFVIASGPIKTLALVGTIILVAVVSFFAVVAYEFIYETIEYIVNEIAKAVSKACDWISEKYQELKDFLANGLNEIKNWFDRNFNNGYEYASSNPQIVVDTHKLRNYAQRLQAVNRRISALDSRLDSLYWSVGLKNLWGLTRADLSTGYSWRLNRCVAYLNDTANNFDNTENSISGNL